jgi:hypothetical protein
MRQERRGYEIDTVMAAYEQAVALLEAERSQGNVRPVPVPAPVEKVRPLVIASIDNVEEDTRRNADDPVEVSYGVSTLERVAGEERAEDGDEETVVMEAAVEAAGESSNGGNDVW